MCSTGYVQSWRNTGCRCPTTLLFILAHIWFFKELDMTVCVRARACIKTQVDLNKRREDRRGNPQRRGLFSYLCHFNNCPISGRRRKTPELGRAEAGLGRRDLRGYRGWAASRPSPSPQSLCSSETRRPFRRSKTPPLTGEWGPHRRPRLATQPAARHTEDAAILPPHPPRQLTGEMKAHAPAQNSPRRGQAGACAI